jgi:hypothetical protein
VNLSVYDVSGRLVQTLINEHRNSGEHRVTFEPGFASSGSYFIKLTSDDLTETKKMMLLK